MTCAPTLDKRQTFAILRPICSRLVDPALKGNLARPLEELRVTLKALDGTSLENCWDYVLYPLILILDQSRAPGAKGLSLRVAEANLQCLKLVLQKCPVPKEDLSTLLGRCCATLDLPRDTSSDEVRSLALDCIMALLSSITQRPELDVLASVGYSARILLKAADSEVLAGLVGSKAVRLQAFRCLGQLIRSLDACGAHDALAFLLPGLLGGLTKGLQDQEGSQGLKPYSGATQSNQASCCCIESLALLVCSVFKDLEMPPPIPQHNFDMQADDPQAVLLALQKLGQHARRPSEPESLSSGKNETQHDDNAPPFSKGSRVTATPGTMPRLLVDREKKWVQTTILKVCERLNLALPALVEHPSPTVRSALAHGVIMLVQSCIRFLGPMEAELLQILFTLSQDGWQSVSGPCHTFLTSVAISNDQQFHAGLDSPHANGNLSPCESRLSHAAVSDVFHRLLKGLPEALAVGSQHGSVHAKKLTTAFQLMGTDSVGCLTRNPVGLQQLCQILSESFSFDPAVTSLLHHPLTRPSGNDDRPQEDLGLLNGADQLCLTDPGSGRLLPRLPTGLLHITTEDTYKSFSNLARTIGRLCASEGGAFQNLLLGLTTRLRACIAQSAETPGSSAWQLKAAAVVTVITEIMYGASKAWTPDLWLANANSPLLEEDCLSFVGQIQEECMSDVLWGVQTHSSKEMQPPERKQPLTLQALSANIVLSKSLVEAIGCAAAACGPGYATSGGLMRSTLLPLVERLGDPCQAVAASAELAVCMLCSACGYDGLRSLISSNIDYVVDGVCFQLREIDRHPRAPYLFAILLRKCGVGPELITILAEPTRQAICGLSIAARQRQPEYVVSFLVTLREIMLGAAEAAGLVAQEMRDIAVRVAAKHKLLESELEDRGAAKPGLPSDFDEASLRVREEYCKQRLDDPDLEGPGVDDDEAMLVKWPAEDWTVLERLHTRLHTIASLAASATEATSVLLTNRNLPVLLLSFNISQHALRALKQTTTALDVREYEIDPLLAKRDAVLPVKPETPKVLPHVHQLWGPLMAAMQDSRGHVVVRSLNALVELSSVSVISEEANFLTQRMKKEALPVMLKLLKNGPAIELPKDIIHRPLIASYESQPPAVIMRTRIAVFSAMHRIAESEGSTALKMIVGDLASQALQFLPGAVAPQLRKEAEQAITAVAKVDRDQVLQVLRRTANGGQELQRNHKASAGNPADQSQHDKSVLEVPEKSKQLQKLSFNGQKGLELERRATDLLAYLEKPADAAV